MIISKDTIKSDILARFTVPLQPITKKNHSQIQIAPSGKRRLIPSRQFEIYQRDAGWFLPKGLNIKQPVNVCAIYYMRTRGRVNITNLESALLDVLVHYEVIADDNCSIVCATDGSRVRYDKDRPRTEVEIITFSE